MIRLSVLDQSIAVAGRSQGASIRDTMEMARHCEALGYDRFWVSEHHNLESIAGSAPEILIAAIAATTTRIRVGSAGVLLPHYSPFKVAEQFRVLDAIAPGRIDLGVGRAPGSDMRTAQALNPRFYDSSHGFTENLQDLMTWVKGDPLPVNHPSYGVRALPLGSTTPEVWMLGSSSDGAAIAARLGLPFCFAHFITEGREAEQAFEIYHERYEPSARWPQPHGAICVWALAADSRLEALRLFRTREQWRLNRDRGIFGPVVSPEEVAALRRTPQEEDYLAVLRDSALIGTPAEVGGRFRKLASCFHLEEIAVLTWTFDLEARKKSYALLADEFGPS